MTVQHTYCQETKRTIVEPLPVKVKKPNLLTRLFDHIGATATRSYDQEQ